MTEIRSKAKGQDDNAAQAQQEARAKALEEDRRKLATGHAEPAKAGQGAGHAAGQADKIGAAPHAEAARTHDVGRSFQQWAGTQAPQHQPPQVGASKAANVEELLKVADLQRKRDPSIKG